LFVVIVIVAPVTVRIEVRPAGSGSICPRVLIINYRVAGRIIPPITEIQRTGPPGVITKAVPGIIRVVVIIIKRIIIAKAIGIRTVIIVVAIIIKVVVARIIPVAVIINR